jgi:hypothetical protein
MKTAVSPFEDSEIIKYRYLYVIVRNAYYTLFFSIFYCAFVYNSLSIFIEHPIVHTLYWFVTGSISVRRICSLDWIAGILQ